MTCEVCDDMRGVWGGWGEGMINREISTQPVSLAIIFNSCFNISPARSSLHSSITTSTPHTHSVPACYPSDTAQGHRLAYQPHRIVQCCASEQSDTVRAGNARCGKDWGTCNYHPPTPSLLSLSSQRRNDGSEDTIHHLYTNTSRH